MNNLYYASVVGFASGLLGTGIGGVLSIFVALRGRKFIGFILEFSAGIMLSVVCFDLLPQAFELGGIFYCIVGIVIGVCAIIFLQNIVIQKTAVRPQNRLLGTGIMMAIGIALHNFPEGLAIGSGFEASATLGISLAAVIALHDVPEGLAMALPMKAGGFSTKKTIIYTILAGIPTGIGSVIGSLLGKVSYLSIAMCLSAAGGAMLYIICSDLLPESKRVYSGRFTTLGNILGFILGIYISFGIS